MRILSVYSIENQLNFAVEASALNRTILELKFALHFAQQYLRDFS